MGFLELDPNRLGQTPVESHNNQWDGTGDSTRAWYVVRQLDRQHEKKKRTRPPIFKFACWRCGPWTEPGKWDCSSSCSHTPGATCWPNRWVCASTITHKQGHGRVFTSQCRTWWKAGCRSWKWTRPRKTTSEDWQWSWRSEVLQVDLSQRQILHLSTGLAGSRVGLPGHWHLDGALILPIGHAPSLSGDHPTRCWR